MAHRGAVVPKTKKKRPTGTKLKYGKRCNDNVIPKINYASREILCFKSADVQE